MVCSRLKWDWLQVLQARGRDHKAQKAQCSSGSGQDAANGPAACSNSVCVSEQQQKLDICTSLACRIESTPNKPDRSSQGASQESQCLCSRIAVLEAEATAQRLAAEAAWRSNSALSRRLSELLGSPPCSAIDDHLVHSPPVRAHLSQSDWRSTALGSVGNAEADERLLGNTCSDVTHLVATSGQFSSAAVAVCDRRRPAGSPGCSVRSCQTPRELSGQPQPHRGLSGAPQVPAGGPCQQLYGLTTPPLQRVAGLLVQDLQDGGHGRAAERSRPAGCLRRAATDPLAGHRSPSFRQSQRLPPALQCLPAHMHRYAPPSILAELAPVASPVSAGPDARLTQQAGMYLAERSCPRLYAVCPLL